MPQIVPLQAVPNQTLQIQLNGQICTLEIYQTDYELAINVYVAGALIIGGVICQNLNRIIRSLYLGFSGDLSFLDTQGTSDPVYTGLGSRWLLYYLFPSDLPFGQG
jgi:hypothetical protein